MPDFEINLQRIRLYCFSQKTLDLKSACKLLVLSVVLLWLAGCASTRDNPNPSFLGKIYRNTTLRYNGYYYGKMKFKKIEKSLTTAHTDFYDTLLALDPLEYADGSSSGKDLDSIVKKMSLVTQIHKKSKWTPNCYFLMGKAYYYKKDYQSARATFEYITANYKDKRYDGVKNTGSVAVKNPAPGKPLYEKGKASFLTFIKHNPDVNEAKLWLVKSYLAQGDYSDGESLLNYLQEQKDFPYGLRGEQELLLTDLYLKQNKLEDAEVALQNTILLTGTKKLRARFAFVLAQLYEENNDAANAVAAYKSVLKGSPTQQMEFYTRIKLAQLDEATQSVPAKQIISDLKGMAGDKRFYDERDVIYYTMAEVELKEGNATDAMTYLDESIKKSTNNDQQKGLSFLQIGELNFADESYQEAKMDYDSALSFLDKKYPKLPEVQSRSKILTNLANQFTIIQNEDSLQQLAAMSDKDRDKEIDAALKKLNKHIADTSGDDEDDQETMDMEGANLSDENSDDNATASTGASASTFYFYNNSLKGSGFNSFIQQWGNRKLEDNWRRSNKNTNANQATATVGTQGASTTEGSGVSAGAVTKDELLKNIPLTPDLLKKSNERIADAFFTLGTIYKDDLGNNAKAIETFEKLNTKFPDYSKQAEVDYYLFLLYNLAKNTAKADQYKQIILAQFPKSDYALTINRGYQASEAIAADEVTSYYTATYDSFNRQNYELVLLRATAADSLYKGSALLPKFALLRAISTGKLAANNDSLKKALQSFLMIYTTGPEAQSARGMLNALMNSSNINTKAGTSSKPVAIAPTNVQPPKQIVNPDEDEEDNGNDTTSSDNTEDTSEVASNSQGQQSDTASASNSTAPQVSDTASENSGAAQNSGASQSSIHAETTSTAYQPPRVNGTHYVVIATENPGKITASNPVHDSVSAFDKKFYKESHLFTTTQPLNAQVNLLVIKSFINSANATKYLTQLQDHPFMKQPDASGQTPVIFCIDSGNFGLLVQSKDINGYLGFYNQNYH